MLKPGKKNTQKETIVVMDSCDDQKKSGYEVNLIDDLPQRLKCPLCKSLIRSPIQTQRGELACQFCYDVNKRDNICPIDHEPITDDTVHRDRFQEQIIMKMNCYCINRERGCEWQGIVAEAEDHHSLCPYKPSNCCFCQLEIKEKSTDEHLTQCSTLIEVFKDGACFFHGIGCPFRPSCIEELARHLQRDAYQHTYLQQVKLTQYKTKSENQQMEYKQIVNNTKEMEENFKGQIENLTSQITSIQTQMVRMQQNLRELVTTVSKIEKKRPINGEHKHQDMFKTFQDSIGDVSEKMSTIDLKQQLLENTTYDGRILWKIDQFEHRMQQAITGKVTALHSAPCFTKRYEYKFCGRLYLNGDGIGKCSHLSLFLVVMKSEYDNLLDWSFNKHVMFRLINQENYEKSIQESFLPDSSSSSFQKPVREMNVAAGCPLFITKKKLYDEGFVKDNCIFIEISAK